MKNQKKGTKTRKNRKTHRTKDERSFYTKKNKTTQSARAGLYIVLRVPGSHTARGVFNKTALRSNQV